MVVRKERVVSLSAGGKSSISVGVACVNMEKRIPKSSDSFSLVGTRSGHIWNDLRKLIGQRGFADESSRFQQIAIWTITDNPSPRDYPTIETADSFGIIKSRENYGPSNDEIARMRELFEQARIDPTGYWVFNADSPEDRKRRAKFEEFNRKFSDKAAICPRCRRVTKIRLAKIENEGIRYQVRIDGNYPSYFKCECEHCFNLFPLP